MTDALLALSIACLIFAVWWAWRINRPHRDAAALLRALLSEREAWRATAERATTLAERLQGFAASLLDEREQRNTETRT